MDIKNYNSEKTNDMLFAVRRVEDIANDIHECLERHLAVFETVTAEEAGKLQSAAEDAINAYLYVTEQLYYVEGRLQWEEEKAKREGQKEAEKRAGIGNDTALVDALYEEDWDALCEALDEAFEDGIGG
ncbi:MAG: hypothetical protein N0C90_12900 [Candidatus Thiodiazotropha endolucinida]|nr:hypothetical protein [Candidatus Thiodiazotropha taylori]MCW4262259.1 hypothetical protein [Candidatus Thiodiazotropha endolucinida]